MTEEPEEKQEEVVEMPPADESPAEGSPSSSSDSPAEGTVSESAAPEEVEAELEAEPVAEEAPAKPKRAPRKKKVEAEAETGVDADAGAEEAEPEAKPKRGAKAAKPAKDAKPAKPAAAPRRRRSAREPGLPIPVVRAQAKYVRSSARKARLVCDHIRGKSVEEARAILAHTPRAVARDWSKLLESAIANAEHNHELVGEDLYVKAVHADEGPTIKRFRPRAQGRATKIRKRTAHLTILLTPKD